MNDTAYLCSQQQQQVTTTPISCYPGYYCTEGLSAPLLCTAGHYCPNGTEVPVLCPNGTITLTNPGNQSSVDVCTRCPAGTAGVDPNRLECTTCAAGHICLTGAITTRPTNDTERGYICPRGSFCPAGATSPTGCPAGTFGESEGLVSSEGCTDCVAGTYNPYVSQTACFACGSDATSTAKATACTCLGGFRAYQASDASCICQPGYQFFENGLSASDRSSTIECEPIVYQRCSGGRNSTGDCSSSCADFCVSGSGRLSATTGVCDCDGIANENEICDERCRTEQKYLVVDPGVSAAYIIDPLVSTNTLDGEPAPTGAIAKFSLSGISAGILDCQVSGSSTASSTCDVQIIFSHSRGSRGVYNPSTTFLSSLFNSSSSSSATITGGPTSTSNRRRLLQSSDEPTVCSFFLVGGPLLSLILLEGVQGDPACLRGVSFLHSFSFLLLVCGSV